MICTAYFDNSADNLANPDPSKEVNWGEQTWDEMMFGFYSIDQGANRSRQERNEDLGQRIGCQAVLAVKRLPLAVPA